MTTLNDRTEWDVLAGEADWLNHPGVTDPHIFLGQRIRRVKKDADHAVLVKANDETLVLDRRAVELAVMALGGRVTW